MWQAARLSQKHQSAPSDFSLWAIFQSIPQTTCPVSILPACTAGHGKCLVEVQGSELPWLSLLSLWILLHFWKAFRALEDTEMLSEKVKESNWDFFSILVISYITHIWE